MRETYLTIEEFARFERLKVPTVRKNMRDFPAEKMIPAAGRGKSGGSLLSSALLSDEGKRRFLACPSPSKSPLAPLSKRGEAAGTGANRTGAAVEACLAALSAEQRDEALFWHRTMGDFRRLLTLRKDWTLKQAAAAFVETLPEEYRVSVRTFRDKFRAWKKGGLAAVAPKPKAGRPSADIHPKLQAWMYRHYIKKTKGRNRRLSAEAAIAKAEREGWRPCPSQATLERILRDTPGNVLYGEQGKKALDDHILPSSLRSYTEPAMWMACGDHHRFDEWVRCKDGKVRRLWCTMWLDHRSRVALGWEICEQPSSRTIALAFRTMANRYGVPEVVEIDNGADYIREQLIGTQWHYKKAKLAVCSEAEEAQLQGAFQACGVKRVVRAIVKNAKSKLVERFFRTVEEQFGKGLPGYCGSNAVERKQIDEALGHPVEESKDLLDEDEFRELFRRWIEEKYHQRVHSGEGMHGRSPAQCFKEEVREVAHPPKENLDLLFLEPKTSTMQKQGFNLLGGWYRNPDLQHAHFSPKKSKLERTFIVRYDRGDLSQVRVYDRKDRYLGIAPRIGRIDYDTEDEHKRRKREHKEYLKHRDNFWAAQDAFLEADMTAADAIGVGEQAVVNAEAPSKNFAKTTRYVLKAEGPETASAPSERGTGRVVPLKGASATSTTSTGSVTKASTTSAGSVTGVGGASTGSATGVASEKSPPAPLLERGEHEQETASDALKRRIAEKLQKQSAKKQPAARRQAQQDESVDAPDLIAERLKSRFF